MWNSKRPEGDPDKFSDVQVLKELENCSAHGVDSFLYFCQNYIFIQSNDEGGWIKFELWDTDCSPYDNQIDAVRKIAQNRYVVILKARQVGVTWICLAYICWLTLFFPPTAALLLSKGEDESKALKTRLEKMLEHLPSWLRPSYNVDNKKELSMINGSYVRCDSPRGGDSMTFNVVVVDEADLIYRSKTSLKQVMLNVEPTIGTTGQLVLLSKSDKNRPSSTFKKLYKASIKRKNRFENIFIPWQVNPLRTEEWYQHQKNVSLSIDETLDYLHESYPQNPLEALRGKSANKRVPFAVIEPVYKPIDPIFTINQSFYIDPEMRFYLEDDTIPLIPGLIVYKLPQQGGSYVMSADPSEGLKDGDPSPIVVMDLETLEDVAVLNERLDPTQLASAIEKISHWFNRAPLLYENNNHGHALKVALAESDVTLLHGWTATTKTKPGWNTNGASKSVMYDNVVALARRKECVIHHEDTMTQLTGVDSTTLKAPSGEFDDLAVAYSLCLAAATYCNIQFDIDFISH